MSVAARYRQYISDLDARCLRELGWHWEDAYYLVPDLYEPILNEEFDRMVDDHIASKKANS